MTKNCWLTVHWLPMAVALAHSLSEFMNVKSKHCRVEAACAAMYRKKEADRQPPAESTSDNDAPDATKSDAEPRRNPCQVAPGRPAATATRAKSSLARAFPPSLNNGLGSLLPSLFRERSAPTNAQGPHIWMVLCSPLLQQQARRRRGSGARRQSLMDHVMCYMVFRVAEDLRASCYVLGLVQHWAWQP